MNDGNVWQNGNEGSPCQPARGGESEEKANVIPDYLGKVTIRFQGKAWFAMVIQSLKKGVTLRDLGSARAEGKGQNSLGKTDGRT